MKRCLGVILTMVALTLTLVLATTALADRGPVCCIDITGTGAGPALR